MSRNVAALAPYSRRENRMTDVVRSVQTSSSVSSAIRVLW